MFGGALRPCSKCGVFQRGFKALAYRGSVVFSDDHQRWTQKALVQHVTFLE